MHRPALAPLRTRLAQLPGIHDGARFVNQLLSPTRASAVRAVIDGVIVAVTLKKRGVRPLLPGPGAGPAALDPDRTVQVAAAVDAGLALIPVAPTCLRRTLTLIRELKRLGLEATIHIGVRRVGGRVEAHAWVQARDLVVNDDSAVIQTYEELAAGDLERLLPLLR